LNKLRGSLVFSYYYHKFVKNYGQIEAPLTTLLKKETFSWIEATKKYFEKLNEAMCTTLVLARPDFIETFIMECDALGHRKCAFLMQ
jgi:hypothetical protein